MIRILLPTHLWRLANVKPEVILPVEGPITMNAVLDVLEDQYPMLKGTIRDQVSKERRAYVRYFASGEDWSFEPTDRALPESVAEGKEPLRIVGAMSGG